MVLTSVILPQLFVRLTTMQFNKPKNTPQTSFDVTIIAKMMKVVGDIESASDIRIEGEVRGPVQTRKKVIIAVGAKVIGDIQANYLEVHGELEGNASVKSHVILGNQAIYKGSLNCLSIEIAKGCKIIGSVSTNGFESPEIDVEIKSSPVIEINKREDKSNNNIIPILNSRDLSQNQVRSEENGRAYW